MAQQGPERSDTGVPSGSAARQGSGIIEVVKGAAYDVAEQARAAGSSLLDEASSLGGTVKQGLSDQIKRQKNGIADRLSAVDERAQTTANDLRDQEAWLGNLIGRGADELDGIAEEIRRNDVTSMLGSVEVFARRQPALFVATVALGFALARFIGGGLTAADGYNEPFAREGEALPGGAHQAENHSIGIAGRPFSLVGISA
jgi:hypothetical protein